MVSKYMYRNIQNIFVLYIGLICVFYIHMKKRMKLEKDI